MNKEDFIKIVKEKFSKNTQTIVLRQIKNYYKAKENYKIEKQKFDIGEQVKLKKGTLLHGTYRNLTGLKEILKDGLISSCFINARVSKYPSSVSVWNLKQDYYLKDYIDFYSGGTILYAGVFENGKDTQCNKTAVIPYSKMNNIIEESKKYDCHMWNVEETKEARFLPSLLQDRVQIGIIFDSNNKYIEKLLKGDILSNSISNRKLKEFVNPSYYERFIKDKKHKNDFFTDRESAIIFGIPSNFIEGILVGRNYEKDKKILEEIKKLLPNSYICNLDGIVIK